MKSKFIIVIYTHKKTFVQRKLLIDYYVNNIKYPIYLVTGDKDLKHKNILYINFNESYDQLGLKTYLTFKKLKKIKFDYLIKLNDDTLFNLERFEKENIKGIDYLGKMENKNKESSKSHYFKVSDKFKIPKKTNLYEYMEGGFVVLSRKAYNFILSKRRKYFINTPEEYSGEDQKIGEILCKFKKKDLNCKYSKMLNMDITKNGISFHPVHRTLVSEMLDKSFEEQLDILSKNSFKNEYNISELLFDNNSSFKHRID